MSKWKHLVGQQVKYAHPAGEVTGKVERVHGNTLYVQPKTVEGYPGQTIRFTHRPERNRWVQAGHAVGPVLHFTGGAQ